MAPTRITNLHDALDVNNNDNEMTKELTLPNGTGVPHELGAFDTLLEKTDFRVQNLLATHLPPERRKAWTANTKAFVYANPKLSILLGTNIILTGVPILTFAIFAFSVSIWSLLAGVIIGLGGALVFTLISISLAFFALLPTIVGMTALACLIAACGSTAYFVFERARGKTSTTAATAENEHGGVHQKKLGNSGNAPTQAVSADGLEKLRREHSKEKPTAAWLDQVTTAMQQQPGKPTSGMTNQSQVLRPAVEPGDSQTKVVDRSTSQKGHHERPRQVDGNVEGFNNLVRESGLAERKSSGIDEEIRREAREAAKREAMRLPHAKEVMPDD